MFARGDTNQDPTLLLKSDSFPKPCLHVDQPEVRLEILRC